MQTNGRPYTGPAAIHGARCAIGDGDSVFSGPPPSYSIRESINVYSRHMPTQRNYPDDERRPLLSSSRSEPEIPVPIATLLIFGAIVIIWPLAYFAYSLVFVPSQVALYKNLFEDARFQVDHLLVEKATLLNEADDLREQLSKAKEEAFWEIARTLDTNMYVSIASVRTVLTVCEGMSGWELMIQVLDPSSGHTESRPADTIPTTLP